MGAGDTALAIADSLRACLDAQISEHSAPVCFCGLWPGSSVVAEWCGCETGGQQQQGRQRPRETGCGMAWVRLDRVFSSGRFPQPDLTPTMPGGVAPLAAVIEVGIFRCLPTMSATGTPPSLVDQAEAFVRQTEDLTALHRTISCCEAVTSRQHSAGIALPRESGGCGGWVWPVTVQLSR